MIKILEKWNRKETLILKKLNTSLCKVEYEYEVLEYEYCKISIMCLIYNKGKCRCIISVRINKYILEWCVMCDGTEVEEMIMD